jgi:predicted Zn-ribbon and HTH transcriptional regulator
MEKCICGKNAEKAIKVKDKRIFLCDDCASTLLIDVAKQLEKKGIATQIKFEGTGTGMIIGKNKCQRCGWEWMPRTLEKAIICPKCKSPYWNKQK